MRNMHWHSEEKALLLSYRSSKRKRNQMEPTLDTVTLTVSSTLLDPEELELTFDITAADDDGSLFVELREPRDCKFSFSIWCYSYSY